jgi:hypothetical protein
LTKSTKYELGSGKWEVGSGKWEVGSGGEGRINKNNLQNSELRIYNSDLTKLAIIRQKD